MLRVLPPHKKPTRIRESKLSAAPVSAHVQMLSMHLDSSLRRPLERMGIVSGRNIKIVYTDHKGTVVIELDGENFILGRKETSGIVVRYAEA